MSRLLFQPCHFNFSFSLHPLFQNRILKSSASLISFCLQGTLLLDRYPVEVLARCTDMNATGKWKKDYNCHYISRSAIWTGPAFLCRPKSAQVSLHQGSRPDRLIMQTATWNPNSAQTQPLFWSFIVAYFHVQRLFFLMSTSELPDWWLVFENCRLDLKMIS